MSKYLFHEVANDLYHFVWHTYCDWYIEFAKLLLSEEKSEYEETVKNAVTSLLAEYNVPSNLKNDLERMLDSKNNSILI